MQFEMKMPDLATTESDIKVLRWLVEVGQSVTRGQIIVEIETDKATMEVECPKDGVVTSIVAKAEESVAVGQLIATIEVE